MDTITRHRARMKMVHIETHKHKPKETSNKVRCPKCFSTKVRTIDKQRRRADEGMDTSVICEECGYIRNNTI